MKEKDLRPGTVFPVLGTLLFFLPERYKEKLCCVTPLASEVGYPFLSARLFSPVCMFIASRPHQPADISAKPFHAGQKDVGFTSEEESDSEETNTKIVPSSVQILPPVVQETAL